MRSWKLGVSTADTAPEGAPLLLLGSIRENLEKAKTLGYDAIEVHTREDVQYDFEKIKNDMAETGIRIIQLVTGRLNTEGLCSILDDRPYVVEACMKGMYTYIDMAAEIGADVVLGWAKGNVPAGKSSDKYIARLAGNLRKLNDYGKEKGVRINIEVINHYEVNIFVTAQETVDFIEKYDLDNCYVHLDAYHMQLEELDPVEAIRTAKDHLGYFHIADSTRWYPGSGQMDLIEILETLEKVGYDGYVTVECFCHGDGYQTAEKAIKYLKNIMK